MADRFVGIYLLILVVVSRFNISEASGTELAVPSNESACERIFEYFSYCLGFVVGSPGYEKPSKRCCAHVEKLNILAKHKTGPRRICWCIQLMVKGKTPPLIPSKIDELPTLCHTHLSFPISDSMDCSKVG